MVGRIYRKKQSGLLIRDLRHSKIFFIRLGAGVIRAKVFVQNTNRTAQARLYTQHWICNQCAGYIRIKD